MFPSPSPIFAGGANGSYVRSIAFSPDSRHIVTACDDSSVDMYCIVMYTIKQPFNHNDYFTCITYNPTKSNIL